jgi:DNA-binding transcriptional MerR regulator
MRISELARRSGVPVGTVKFYLREGLLPPGVATSPTQAHYDEAHVARLRLVRSLVGAGGLSVARARTVLAVVDDPSVSVPDALGVAHAALSGAAGDAPDLGRAREQVQRWGWTVDGDSTALADLARALEGTRAGGVAPSDEVLDRYARAARKLARKTVPDVAAEAVVSAVLFEPVLLALLRLARQDSAGRGTVSS